MYGPSMSLSIFVETYKQCCRFTCIGTSNVILLPPCTMTNLQYKPRGLEMTRPTRHTKVCPSLRNYVCNACTPLWCQMICQNLNNNIVALYSLHEVGHHDIKGMCMSPPGRLIQPVLRYSQKSLRPYQIKKHIFYEYLQMSAADVHYCAM